MLKGISTQGSLHEESQLIPTEYLLIVNDNFDDDNKDSVVYILDKWAYSEKKTIYYILLLNSKHLKIRCYLVCRPFLEIKIVS